MSVTIVGNNTPTAGAVAYGDGTNIVFNSAGTTGQVLTSAGTGTPTWSTPATGAMTLISTQTASSSANISFTGLTLDKYVLVLNNLTPASTSYLTILLGTGSGPSYLSSGYYYNFMRGQGSTITGVAAGNQSYFLVTNASLPNGLSGTLNFVGLTNTTSGTAFTGAVATNLGTYLYLNQGSISAGAAVTAIQLVFSSSTNIASGTASLYSISS